MKLEIKRPICVFKAVNILNILPNFKVLHDSEINILNMHVFGYHNLENGEGNGNPLQYSCLENPMDGGAWWTTVHGVAKSQT